MPNSNNDDNVVEKKPLQEAMEFIHDRVDEDLAKAITDFVLDYVKKNRSDGNIKNTDISATFTWMLADSLCQMSSQKHEHVCSLSNAYGAYLHNLCHAMLADEIKDGDTKVQVLEGSDAEAFLAKLLGGKMH